MVVLNLIEFFSKRKRHEFKTRSEHVVLSEKIMAFTKTDINDVIEDFIYAEVKKLHLNVMTCSNEFINTTNLFFYGNYALISLLIDIKSLLFFMLNLLQKIFIRKSYPIYDFKR